MHILMREWDLTDSLLGGDCLFKPQTKPEDAYEK